MNFTYSRELLPDGRCDVNHPDRVDGQGNSLSLAKELQDVLTGIPFRIDINADSVVVAGFTSGDKTVVDQVVADHKANVITAEVLEHWREAHRVELSIQVEQFIAEESRYPARRQRTLTKLQMDADKVGNTACYNYIQAGWDWAFGVMSYYYTVEAILDAATTVVEIQAISLDFTPFENHDRVSVKVAYGMLIV